MALKVVLQRRARSDLAEIRDYLLREAGPEAAERVREHLRVRIQKLGAGVILGVQSSHPMIRILSPARYPYRIYISVLVDRIVVLHIRHTSRQLPELSDLL